MSDTPKYPLSRIAASVLCNGTTMACYPAAFPPSSWRALLSPADFGVFHEELSLHTPDGKTLQAFLLKQTRTLELGTSLYANLEDGVPGLVDGLDAPDDDTFAASRPTVLMLHGNGMRAGDQSSPARVFYLKMRLNVLLLEYRGFGTSTGSPSEKGIRKDAQTAFDYIIKHPILGHSGVFVYGQSMGGAVAIDLVSRNSTTHDIRALIIENTFTSLGAVVASMMPFLKNVLRPFSWRYPLSMMHGFLLRSRWFSALRVPLIAPDLPVLVLSGLLDQIIPASHSRELWDLFKARGCTVSAAGKYEPPPRGAYPGAEKDPTLVVVDTQPSTKSRYVTFSQSSHNDTCIRRGYWLMVQSFVEEVMRTRDVKGLVDGI